MIGSSKACWCGALLLVLVAGGCARSTKPTPTRPFAHGGVTVRYPREWSATARNDTPVIDPALCFTLRRRGPGGRVSIKLVEYLPPDLHRYEMRGRHAFFPARPRRFRLAALERGDVRWTSGRILRFRERGRAFFVGVTAGSKPGSDTGRAVERVLDAIRVGPGRCRPTAGAGSRP